MVIDICSIALLLVMGIILFLIALPIYFIALPFLKQRDEKFEAAYLDFLSEQNANKFFIYTNKKKNRKFVEEVIIPNLHEEIKVIFLEGKIPRSEFEIRLVSRLLNDQKIAGGFPWLINISDSKVHAYSINNAVYNAMRGGNPQAVLSLINSPR
jgi:hypothetical protein